MKSVDTQRIAGVATLGLGYTFSPTDGWSAAPNAALTTNNRGRSRRDACGSSFGGRQARRLLREIQQAIAPRTLPALKEAYEPRRRPLE
jgi:hypothetical protein